jgi:hypothetical protein
MAVINTLAYYNKETIAVAKNIILQAREAKYYKALLGVTCTF